ncbi:LuxR C-terminal-related transcriptional regulator [Kribbella sp. NBC_01484]|uniref:helix-turn-helix transcriptional regulator n=1 Tax=Kribbella sp. NBC_01484 TaxID=2903579 RepID=UPI002E37E52B|nr:LuxR C-terminal-related transcriptional regulator [Kribbella sp. NBC_01484]
MSGVTVVLASYAGAASAPAYVRLAGLVDELHGEKLVRRDAAGPIVVFDDPATAVSAARTLRAAASGAPAAELLRIAVHTGSATGAAVRHAEQLLEIANPGQTLLTATAAAGLPDVTDLGLHRLKDLGSPERIFELTETTGPLRSLDRVPNNLPVMFTSFVGRQTQLAALRTQLSGNRLVTLTGPGGSGKTRLAAQSAAQLAERWPDGVWWVDLAAVTEGKQITEVVATAVGVLVEAGDRTRLLIGQLRIKQALICLDNCEQIIDAVAEFVVALQTACPEISVLATSREPLDIPGEAIWRVPALAPDEARTLFVERAGAEFPESEQAIRSICVRLDGMPLALELAAAWVRTLTPEQIESGLDDRFGLLTKNVRGVAARQQTLAASIDWSHELLDADERHVFRRLAVFAGGFTLDAARAVCGRDGVLEIFGRLVDKSLVVAEAGRYRLLETIREYAGARLRDANEEDAVRDLQLDHYLAVAEAAEPLLDSDRDKWRALIEPDRENYRAALDHGLSRSDTERGRRLAAALPWMWNLQATGSEGIGILRCAIDSAPDERSLLQARLLYGYASVADTVDPFGYDAAGRGLGLATELGADRLRSLLLALVAVGKFFTGFQDAWDLTEEGRLLAEGIGDDAARDANLALQCVLLALWDRHDELRAMLEIVTPGLLARGERGIATTLLLVRSESLASTGELRQAIEVAGQALATAEPLADFHRVGTARGQLATLLARSGRLDEAYALMQPLLDLVDAAVVPNLGQVMGVLSLWKGDHKTAVEWMRPIVDPDSPMAQTYVPAMLLPTYAAALQAGGHTAEAIETADRGVSLSREYGLPKILAEALDQLGRCLITEQPEKAADLLHESLTTRLDHGLRTQLVDSLESLALLANHTNRPADATRLTAAAAAARTALGYTAPAGRPAPAGLPAPADGPEPMGVDEAPLSLDEAVAYARRTRGARGRPSSGWASLTPTEEQVVALAVEGLSNPEIGERLFISRGTVKTHLAHVYAKLGVANRTELASLKKT